MGRVVTGDVLVVALLLACAGAFLASLARTLVSAHVRLALAKPLSCDTCLGFWMVLLAADLAQYAPGYAPWEADFATLACAAVPAFGICLVVLKVLGALGTSASYAPGVLPVAFPGDNAAE